MLTKFNKFKFLFLIISALLTAVFILIFMTGCKALPPVNSSALNNLEENMPASQTEEIEENTDDTVISEKISFELVNTLPLPEQSIATDIWSDGEIVYVLSSYEGLTVIDVRNKNNPEISNIIQTDGFANAIFVSEDLIFIASGNSNFEILDKSDKYNPFSISKTGTIAPATDIFVSGSYAFLSVADKGIQIFDISDKNKPEIISSIALEGTTYGVYLNNNYLYACAYLQGIYEINISNISSPEINSVFKEITHPSDIYVEDDYALIANNYPEELAKQNGIKNPAGLYFIDLKNKNNTAAVPQFFTQISELHVYNNNVFIACLEDGVKAVSANAMKNNDEDKIPLAEAKVDGSVCSVYASGDYLFVLSNIFEPAVSEKETETVSKPVMNIFKIITEETVH